MLLHPHMLQDLLFILVILLHLLLSLLDLSLEALDLALAVILSPDSGPELAAWASQSQVQWLVRPICSEVVNSLQDVLFLYVLAIEVE